MLLGSVDDDSSMLLFLCSCLVSLLFSLLFLTCCPAFEAEERFSTFTPRRTSEAEGEEEVPPRDRTDERRDVPTKHLAFLALKKVLLEAIEGIAVTGTWEMVFDILSTQVVTVSEAEILDTVRM